MLSKSDSSGKLDRVRGFALDVGRLVAAQDEWGATAVETSARGTTGSRLLVSRSDAD
jgi:hypothetical protein